MSKNLTLKCKFCNDTQLQHALHCNIQRGMQFVLKQSPKSEQLHIVSIAQWGERSIREYSSYQTWKRKYTFQLL